MKKLLWVLGTVIAGIIWVVVISFLSLVIGIIAGIVTRTGAAPLNTTLFLIFICIGWAGLIVLSIVMWKRLQFKCPACKRWGTLELQKTDLTKQENISVIVELAQKNRDRNITGYHDQYVPGKRKTYQDTYKCKHCGNLEARTRIIRKANI